MSQDDILGAGGVIRTHVINSKGRRGGEGGGGGGEQASKQPAS